MNRTRYVLLLVVALTAITSGATASIADDGGDGSARCLHRSVTPFGTGECPGVRPGALIRGTNCTLNFLFRGSDGHRYIGTAGHCALAASGEIVWATGRGPEARGASGKRIGEFAYAIAEGRHDFALIRVDSSVETDPEMCFFGGPYKIYRKPDPEPFLVHHFGHGTLVGTVPGAGVPVLPARSALARDSQDRWRVFIHGVASPGDSGSPVITEDGQAVGVLIGIGHGELHVSRLLPHMKRAEKRLRITLQLVRSQSAMP